MQETKDLKKLIFTELRLLVMPEETSDITDETLTQALTLNENMKAFGYTLRPKDIIRIAGCDMDVFYHDFLNIMDDPKGKPMYPDFPKQVIELEEAEFRLHQALHYFSTYGIEALFGTAVSVGWLPDIKETEKLEEDEALLKAKAVELISEEDMYSEPVRRILSKNERMNDKEKKIVDICISGLGNKVKDVTQYIDIPFKENICPLFISVMDSDMASDEKVEAVHTFCEHTGDVWKAFEPYLYSHKWHLKTKEKKTIVRLFESYPIEDFKANLIITNKKAERVITLLEFLSYNRFSKSDSHKAAVSELRNGDLRSWQSMMHELIEKKDENTVSFIAARPGILLRSIVWLLKKGYKKDDIEHALIENVDALSMHTVVNVITCFSAPDDERNADLTSGTIDILSTVLVHKMALSDVPFRKKKVYIDWQDIDPEHSFISRSEEGGYVRSGLAIKLPEKGRYLRFFCFWNDKKQRIDMDLHALATLKDGKELHIGWNGDYNSCGITFSGDITTSINSAEFIDIDLEQNDIDHIDLNVHSYTGVPFKSVEECFTGLMAVSEAGREANRRQYTGKNVIWSHHLTTNTDGLDYGVMDIKNRVLLLKATENRMAFIQSKPGELKYPEFTLSLYLESYISAADGKLVSSPEEADIVIKMYKAEDDNEISLLDNDYFLAK